MQILFDGTRHAVVKSIAAETIDVSTLEGAPAKVTIEKIIYDVGAATGVQLLWDATTDVLITPLSGQGTMCLEDFGGIKNTEAAGYTGDIVVAATGTPGIILHLRKD